MLVSRTTATAFTPLDWCKASKFLFLTMSIEPFHINTENVNRFFIQGTLIERLHNNGIGQLLSRSYFWYVNVYWVVGIRPTLFTCIALLLVLHTSTSYIKTLMYILLFWEIQYTYSVFLTWYQSHCSNLFLVVLSLLVLLHSQHRFHHYSSCRNILPLNLRCLPAVILGFWTYSRHR